MSGSGLPVKVEELIAVIPGQGLSKKCLYRVSWGTALDHLTIHRWFIAGEQGRGITLTDEEAAALRDELNKLSI